MSSFSRFRCLISESSNERLSERRIRMDNGAESYRRFRENGDETELDKIITDYADGLMLYLTSIVGNIHIAEELTEDTFVLLGTKKPKFREKCSFRTWLYTIGMNKALNYLKKTSRHPAVPIEYTAGLVSDEEAVEEAYIRKEDMITVHRAMRRLSHEYQQVLWLTYFEGLSNKEAAAVMKKTVRSVEALLYRARRSLRTQLEKEGFDYENT